MKTWIRALTGLKYERLAEWRAVVKSEGRRLGWVAVARSLAVAAFGGLLQGRVASRVWRRRLRACAGCPVYDRGRHACRDTDGLGLGCGCWMPAKSLFRGNQCWRRGIGDPGGQPE